MLLVAPTGRAAIRMTEASGVRARTVHSALGWIPGEGPTHDEDDPARLRSADRRRVVDGEPRAARDAAARRGEPTHVVLVGDADQLAPVGCRQAVRRTGREPAPCPTTRLTHIFRQAAGSMIVQGAHAIRRGQPPDFRPRPQMRRDLFLIERADPRPRSRRSSRSSASACPTTTASIRSATSRCSRPSTGASSESTR